MASCFSVQKVVSFDVMIMFTTHLASGKGGWHFVVKEAFIVNLFKKSAKTYTRTEYKDACKCETRGGPQSLLRNVEQYRSKTVVEFPSIVNQG